MARYHENTKDAEVVLIEGLVPTRKHQFANALNYEIAKTLNAIVFVLALGNDSPAQLKERIELARTSLHHRRDHQQAERTGRRSGPHPS